MQFRERNDADRQRNPGDGTPDAAAPGGGLDALRAQGTEFLSAANDIINASLSGDSESFLQANRQAGGQ